MINSDFRFPLRITLLIFVICLFGLNTKAQISQGGVPMALSEQNILLQKSVGQSVPQIELPSIPIKQLLQEDSAITDKSIPERFGYAIKVDYNLENSGIWTNLPNGDRVWQLKLQAEGAKSINLNYSDFYMPKGASFFIYSEENDQVLGAYTHRNNKTHQTFSTQPIKGQSCILEYYEPAIVNGSGRLAISSVVHGYKDTSLTLKTFGNSGDCNVDINCGEGDNWQDVKKGVAMILLADGTRWCTGSLVNNTAQDCRPLFYSANHCVDAAGGEVSNWIFIFNYESAFCDGEDGPIDQSVQGAKILARSTASDFALLELEDNPAEFYDVYFNGWDRNNDLTAGLTCIHHPAGDVKKISLEFDSLQHQGAFWLVPDWDIGTTEQGSSGSPLFNTEKRIIGALTGGDALCGNDGSDLFGKVAFSWNSNGDDSTKRMDYHLDPLGLNPDFLDGETTPCTNDFLYNLEIVEINDPSGDYCIMTELAPEILVKNSGTEVIDSFTVLFNIDGGETMTYQWEGLIMPGFNKTITLPFMPLLDGTHTFNISVIDPNGQIDENLENNSATSTYSNNSLDIECYCETAASTVNEWIASIKIGEYDFVSNDNGGYADFGFVSIPLAPGGTYDVELIPGYNGVGNYPEHWRIWIDLNQDGNFHENDELLFDSGSAIADTVVGSLTLPVNLPTTNTFMRIAMQFNAAPPPCIGYQFGEIEDYGVNIDINNPGGQEDNTDPAVTQPTGISLNTKVMLQGPLMNTAIDNIMQDNMRIKNLIPQAAPYADLPGFSHSDSEILDLASLEISGEAAIVDWLLVEIRDSLDPAIIVASQAVLLRRNGFCMNIDGMPTIEFPNLPQGAYYLAIRHRNHLGMMTANPINFIEDNQLIDFTLIETETWGENARINMGNNLMAMWGGNSSNDGTLIYQGIGNDVNESFFEIINAPENAQGLINFVLESYSSTDANLDGTIIYQGPSNDPNLMFFNAISFPENFNNSPNFIINEQLPIAPE